MTNSPHFYYQVLLWAGILYGGAIAFKLLGVEAMFWAMSAVSERPRRRVPRSPNRKSHPLAVGLGILMLVQALVQVPPALVVLSPSHIMGLPWATFHGGPIRHIVWTSAQVWASHPIAYNIASVMIEATIGVFLLTDRHMGGFGIFAASLLIVYGLAIWVAQGFGYLFALGNPHASAISGWPGSGLLYALMALLLLIQRFGHGHASSTYAILWVAFWGIAALWQIDPWSHLWTPHGQSLLYPTRGFILPLHGLKASIDAFRARAMGAPMVWNALWTAAVVVLALLGWGSPQKLWRVLVGLALLLPLWWIGQGLGMVATYGLALNTAPLLATYLIVRWWDAHKDAQSLGQPDSDTSDPPKELHRHTSLPVSSPRP